MLCVKANRDHVQSLYEAGLYRSAELLGSVLPQKQVTSVTSLFYLAAAFQQMKLYTQAVEKLQQALLLFDKEKQNQQLTITECDIRWLMYQCYHSLCDYENALYALECIGPKSRTVRYYMALGNLYKQTGVERSAVACYKEVLKTHPLALEAIESLMELGQITKEIISLTSETMAGRFDWLVDWIEGCSYSVRNEHPRAIARYQRLLSVNGPSAHVLVRIAISYNSIGAYKKAVSTFEEAYSLEPNLTTYAGTYASLLAQLDSEQELEKFCEHLSEDNQVESYIAHCYLALMKEDFTRATTLSERACHIAPRYIPSLIARGCSEMLSNKTTSAMITFRSILSMKSNCFEAHKGMVMALLRFERHKEAVIAAKESVKQCPGQARTFLLIAHATSRYPEESSKLRERAKDFYLKALTLDPSSEEAVCNLATIYIREGKPKEGLEHIKTYLCSHASARAHTSAGECYLAIRQFEKAHQHFNIALELNRNYVRALNGLQILEHGENLENAENEFAPATPHTSWINI